MALAALLTDSTPEEVAESNLRVHWYGAIVLAILNVLDIITTYWVLSIGGIEGNPLADILIGWQLLIPVKVLVCGIIIWRSRKAESLEGMSVAGVWAAVGVYALVVVLNVITLIGYL